MSIEVRVPALGESVTEATVATWYKKPGDAVRVDEMLCELETDKVTVEVPAPGAGTLGEIVAAEGATVEPNALLATIAEGAGSAPGDAPAARAPGVAAAPQDSPSTAPAGAPVAEPSGPGPAYGGTPGGEVSRTEAERAGYAAEIKDRARVREEAAAPAGRPDAGQPDAGQPGPSRPEPSRTEAERASYAAEIKARGAARDPEDAPSAVKMMADHDLARGAVPGTGRDGRVMKEDVLRALDAPRPAEAPKAPPATPPAPRAPTHAGDVGREERVRMTRLRQTIARRLKEAQNTATMLTTYNEVDMSAIMAIRADLKEAFERKHKVKLGFMSFFVKACCHALLEVPEVNAEIDGDEVVYKRYVHMGVAVGTPTGLVVPVVRDADRKGFAEIEKEIAELGLRARDGKLSMADMQGGSFTISNGGVYGSLMSSPILNPPQSGILGMHKIQDRPVVVGGQIVIRPMMYLALSYDHRIVDGKGAVTFLMRVKEALEDPRRLLMDL